MTNKITVQMRDTFQIDDAAKVRFLDGTGYMVAYPRVARTGIQLYLGSEVGVTDKDVVRVYRPPEAVFDEAAMRSMTHKPVTDDHPPVLVTADNWGKYGKGHSEGEALRDGEFVRVPLMLSDGGLINKYKNGKKEISVGYTCSLDFTPGTTPQGEQYDAVQGDIQCNHHAIVDAARGGEKLRLGDGAGVPVDVSTLATIVSAIQAGKVNKSDALATADSLSLGKGSENYRFTKDGTVYTAALDACRAIAMAAKDGDIVHAIDALLSFINGDSKPAAPKVEKTKMADKTIVVDGIAVNMDAQTAAIVERALKTTTDAFEEFKKKSEKEKEEDGKKSAAKDAQVAELTTTIATKDAEIVTLKKQLDDAQKSTTPAMLDAAVAERTSVSALAKAMLDSVVIDGKTTAEIKRQVVDAQLGDAAKGWNDDMVNVSFASLAKGVQVGDGSQDQGFSTTQQMSDAFRTQNNVATNDSDKFHADRAAGLTQRWKGPAAGAAKH